MFLLLILWNANTIGGSNLIEKNNIIYSSDEINFFCYNMSQNRCAFKPEVNFFENLIRMAALSYAWLATGSTSVITFDD